MERRPNDVEEIIIKRYTRGIHANDRDDVQQTIRLRWLQLRAKHADVGMGLLVVVARCAVIASRRTLNMRSLHKPLKDSGERSIQPIDLVESRTPLPHERTDARDLIRHTMRHLSPRERRIVSAVASAQNVAEAAVRCGMRYDAAYKAICRIQNKICTRCPDSSL
jgi:DNA-directed RNA polymerase specialized sigma24 family protein